MCGNRHSRLTPVTRLKNSLQIRDRDPAHSDFQEGHDHVPDHVLEETVSLNLEPDQSALPPDLKAINGSYRVRATRRVAPTMSGVASQPNGSMSGSLGAIVGQFKAPATKRINASTVFDDEL